MKSVIILRNRNYTVHPVLQFMIIKEKKQSVHVPLAWKWHKKNKSREDDEKILLGAPGSVVNTRSANPKVLG